jgi:hypothetical protein
MFRTPIPNFDKTENINVSPTAITIRVAVSISANGQRQPCRADGV